MERVTQLATQGELAADGHAGALKNSHSTPCISIVDAWTTGFPSPKLRFGAETKWKGCDSAVATQEELAADGHAGALKNSRSTPCIPIVDA
eukprot:824750-Pelagomonas_calceolata.AAC.8